MGRDLLKKFLQEELDASTREVLRLAIMEARKSGSVVAVREFEFNLFDVVIDFERQVVIVQDVLLPATDEGVSISLAEFVRLCGI
ncbi:hypothetical protein [Pseudomonas sp. EL_65y_Pfl2_R96]|uniref:hypothetical protein n=1 Tax=Pseudomonas sp. EL_65y_Pfl2_R96 TaxID=3088699 RepID=UPI0030DCB1D2